MHMKGGVVAKISASRTRGESKELKRRFRSQVLKNLNAAEVEFLMQCTQDFDAFWGKIEQRIAEDEDGR